MADIELDHLLTPLQDDAPCGPDLEYDAAFLALQTAGEGKPEQQYGDTVIPAEEPDWIKVWEQALALAERSRDLRLAVWLVRSGARLKGYQAALSGLALIQGLLERHWDHVHPQLDASDNNDPTMRMNALLPLASPEAALADLRAASLTGQRGGPRVRDVELAFGNVDPGPNESAPSPQGLLEGLGALSASDPALVERLQAGLTTVQAISTLIEQHLGAAQGPDFTPLIRVLKPLAQVAAQLGGGTSAAADDVGAAADGQDGPTGAATAVARIAVPAGVIASREDAMRALQRVCDWIELNEPSNPAPLLIRRAQRLMTKNFMDIIRDLVPDGLSEIERLAGRTDE
ncbi:type VI secretion system protein TssA [Roseateles depolymerans]|uniref:Type VI secretion-associated protein, ImpA family n=1 Tax=Roseateles depolymerans TaxID=76731 RepID=A0A0U3MHW5_9BURK|nr:type VI secretion system protein TssA [Roseateles depolymerans]ALV07132.1 Type VI secretion-associated protein, ImpA family [Roseateles depolymerans]REG20115.1 type VI secretion system protein ImpA [Roseateles depolymerans]